MPVGRRRRRHSQWCVCVTFPCRCAAAALSCVLAPAASVKSVKSVVGQSPGQSLPRLRHAHSLTQALTHPTRAKLGPDRPLTADIGRKAAQEEAQAKREEKKEEEKWSASSHSQPRCRNGAQTSDPCVTNTQTTLAAPIRQLVQGVHLARLSTGTRGGERFGEVDQQDDDRGRLDDADVRSPQPEGWP